MSQVLINNYGVFPPGTVVQTLTGNTGGPIDPDLANNINIVGQDLVTVTGTAINNTLTITVNEEVAATFDADVGSAVPENNILNILGGSNINTAGATDTITINLDDSVSVSGSLTAGTYVQAASPTTSINGGYRIGSDVFVHNSNGTANTYVGVLSGTFGSGTDTSFNTGVGYSTLANLSGFLPGLGSSNVAVGANAGNLISTGSNNIALGSNALGNLASGNSNIGIGSAAAIGMTDGTYNIVIGDNAGSEYVAAETSNILISNIGNASENNTIRIGTTGTDPGQQERTFIAGINGVDVGSVASVVSISGDQLGSATITAGTNITVTPTANTITITGNVVQYTAVSFPASPYTVLSTDYYLGVNTTGGAVTIRLPNTTTTGRIFAVKDVVGNALVANISLTTPGGVVTIDGVTTYVLNTPYRAVQILFNGTSYEIF